MAIDGENSTPLHLAALFGHFEAVKYLVEEVQCELITFCSVIVIVIERPNPDVIVNC